MIHGYNLYGMICTIDETNISVGPETQLMTGISCYQAFTDIVSILENKVFTAYCKSGKVYGMICTVDGTSITINTNEELFTSNAQSIQSSSTNIIQISNNKVLIVHSSIVYICTINGTTMTISATGITAGNVIKLSNNKFVSILASRENYSYKLYGKVFTIDENNNVNIGTKTLLKDTKDGNINFSIAISNNKFFIAYDCTYGSSSSAIHFLEGMLCTIDGTSITIDNLTTLSSEHLYPTSMLRMSKNRILLLCKKNISASILTINNDTIGMSSWINLNNIEAFFIYAINVNNNQILITYSDVSSKNIYGIIVQINYTKGTTGNQSDILGIAKTSGTEGQTVKVLVPNYNEEGGN